MKVDPKAAMVAEVLWGLLAFVLVLYWAEWAIHRRRGETLPLHRHPVAILATAARLLRRLWPLVALVAASGFVECLYELVEVWRWDPVWRTVLFLDPTGIGVAPFHHWAKDPRWVIDWALSGGMLLDFYGVGLLFLAVSVAAGAWLAMANPWRLRPRARWAAGIGALAALVWLIWPPSHWSGGPLSAWLVMWPLEEGTRRLADAYMAGHLAVAAGALLAIANPWRLRPRARWAAGIGALGALVWLGWLPSHLGVVLSSPRLVIWPLQEAASLLAAVVWVAGFGRTSDLRSVPRRALPGFLAGSVALFALLAVELATRQLPGSVGQDYVRPLVDWTAYVALVWAVWAGVGTRRGPFRSVADLLRLIWRRWPAYLLLWARMAAFGAPIFALAVYLRMATRHALVGPPRTALIALVHLWLFTATGVAYMAFSTARPSGQAECPASVGEALAAPPAD